MKTDRLGNVGVEDWRVTKDVPTFSRMICVRERIQLRWEQF